ncbi:MAG: hypothetical protein RLZZ29_143, partial [Cyanobacteriota bacterium]
MSDNADINHDLIDSEENPLDALFFDVNPLEDVDMLLGDEYSEPRSADSASLAETAVSSVAPERDLSEELKEFDLMIDQHLLPSLKDLQEVISREFGTWLTNMSKEYRKYLDAEDVLRRLEDGSYPICSVLVCPPEAANDVAMTGYSERMGKIMKSFFTSRRRDYRDTLQKKFQEDSLKSDLVNLLEQKTSLQTQVAKPYIDRILSKNLLECIQIKYSMWQQSLAAQTRNPVTKKRNVSSHKGTPRGNKRQRSSSSVQSNFLDLTVNYSNNNVVLSGFGERKGTAEEPIREAETITKNLKLKSC